MINFARKYPFLLLLPSLIIGITIGNQITVTHLCSIVIVTSALLLLLLTLRYNNYSIMEYFIPVALICIGVVVSNYNLSGIIPQPVFIKQQFLPFISNIREYFITKNDNIISDSEIGGIANAIVLGDKSELSYEIKQLFSRCGIMHIAAVSGLHVGAVFIMVKRVASLINISPLRCKITALIFIWIYSLVTGLSPSVVRASAILTYSTLGESINRNFSSLNGIFACAFITLIIAPETIYNLSFQLSHAAYVGIITLLPLFAPAKKGGNKIAKWFVTSLGISVAAQLLTLPITIYYFNSISTNSFILNMAIVPLVSIFLYLNIFALVTPHPIADLFGEATRICGRSIIDITHFAEPINIYVREIYIGLPRIYTYYIILLILFIVLRKTIKI